MKEDKDQFIICSLPEIIDRSLPKNVFEECVKKKIIKRVDRLPKDVFDVVYANFSNRPKQSSSSDFSPNLEKRSLREFDASIEGIDFFDASIEGIDFFDIAEH